MNIKLNEKDNTISLKACGKEIILNTLELYNILSNNLNIIDLPLYMHNSFTDLNIINANIKHKQILKLDMLDKIDKLNLTQDD